MNKWLLRLILLGVGIAITSSQFIPLRAVPALQYKVYSLPDSFVHTVVIPKRFEVKTALSPTVETLENFAHRYGAIAVLNGGFFDPNNHKTTSYVIQQGQVVADPKDNERLINNPHLAAYLEQILNRSEFRRYQCGSTVRYDITSHRQPIPESCRLVDALGGGPSLLPENTAVAEGFLDYTNGEISRDPLGSRQANARTAIGITRQGDLLWVMAAQTKPNASGLSLEELTDFLKTLGAQKAMNLDGGSSAALYYQGKTFYGKVNEQGLVQRPVKSVLLLQK